MSPLLQKLSNSDTGKGSKVLCLFACLAAVEPAAMPPTSERLRAIVKNRSLSDEAAVVALVAPVRDEHEQTAKLYPLFVRDNFPICPQSLLESCWKQPLLSSSVWFYIMGISPSSGKSIEDVGETRAAEISCKTWSSLFAARHSLCENPAPYYGCCLSNCSKKRETCWYSRAFWAFYGGKLVLYGILIKQTGYTLFSSP